MRRNAPRLFLLPSNIPGAAGISMPTRTVCRTFSAAILSVMLVACSDDDTNRGRIAIGNPDSGKLLIEFYRCGSCHEIPGVSGAHGVMGPPLTGFGKRGMIAGAVENEPDKLVEWIMNPHAIEPGTAMPPVGATVPEARDMASYLYTLR